MNPPDVIDVAFTTAEKEEMLKKIKGTWHGLC